MAMLSSSSSQGLTIKRAVVICMGNSRCLAVACDCASAKVFLLDCIEWL
jgi:hypothetical protein